MLKISILTDNPDSWIVPFAKYIRRRLAKEYLVRLFFKTKDIPKGDMLFLLGCTSIVPKNILCRNKHNFVIHESNLPKGRGWSPLAWQILEGKKNIPIVIFEATEEVDSGPIYFKDYINLDGTELLPEIRKKQGEKTIELVKRIIKAWPNIKGRPQKGKATYYPKRSRQDDQLNPKKSIIKNFNKLRIVDNEKYSAWFKLRGQKYIIEIYKDIT